MRLLFVGHSSGLLGAERSMVDIVSGAVADGHDVTVVLPQPGPLNELLERAGAEVRICPVRAWMGAWHWLPPVGAVRLLQARRAATAIEQQVRLASAEAVVTNTSVVPSGAIAAARVGVPHIWIVRESLRDNPQLRSLLPKRVIARRVLQQSDVLCTISTYVEEQLFDVAGKTEHRCAVQVSPNPAAGVPSAGAPPVGTPRLFLLPGFFSREKGQHLVVIGAFLARRRGADMRLRLVGRGSRTFTMLLRLLVKVLRLGPTVEIVGWTDDLAGEYARAHFVLTASRNEAFGRTVVEAFAHGRPVIGMRRGATALLLEEGGGVAVSPSTARAFGDAMATAVNLSDAAYDALCHEAANRGMAFRRGQTQYEAFRQAIDAIQHCGLSAE